MTGTKGDGRRGDRRKERGNVAKKREMSICIGKAITESKEVEGESKREREDGEGREKR